MSKAVIGRRGLKIRVIKMYSNLKHQQIKIITERKMIERQVDWYINLRVTANQKSIIDTHTQKKKKFKITLKY